MTHVVNEMKYNTVLLKPFLISLCSMVLLGCGQTVVKSTKHVPLEISSQDIAESQLLDLGVVPFDPGLDVSDEDDATILAEVRNAESRFIANQLVDTIQRSAAWGAVRTLPGNNSIVDVYVNGTILHSDGERLELDVSVTDTSGREWYTKKYVEVVGQYSYQKRRQLKEEPFQGVYNRIANDLVEFRKKISSERVEALRTISEIRFAREFSPQAFSDYISENKKGEISLTRLPAENDPQLLRIQKIRDRDYLFIDTVQEYYDAFSRRMQTPYHEWRASSYEEILAVRELKRQSRNRTIAGVVSVVGGIAAATSSNSATRAAGGVAIGAGGVLVKSGLSKREEVQMHVEALVELGQSLEAEIEPQVVELEDRTITLTGNVEAQYEQWKTLLAELYKVERGSI